MAETKKYYWIKLKTDFFESETIDWLSFQPNGCEYVVLYLKLCLLTANKNGELSAMIGDIIMPYDVNRIARITKFPFDTVVVALELFKKIGLIYEQDNGILKIPYVGEVVGSETEHAEKKRRYRERQKTLTETKSRTLSDKSIENRDKSKEIRDEEIRDREEEGETERKSPDPTPSEISEIIDLYHEICVSLPKVAYISDKIRENIQIFVSEFTPEQIRTGFETAEKSDFLKGENARKWQASFEWLIIPDNFAKSLNGNYNNAKKSGNAKRSDGFNAEEYECLINAFENLGE